MKEKVASTYRERKVDNSVKPVVALRSVSSVTLELGTKYSLYIATNVWVMLSQIRSRIEEWGKRERDRDRENLTQRDKLDSYFSISFRYTHERKAIDTPLT